MVEAADVAEAKGLAVVDELNGVAAVLFVELTSLDVTVVLEEVVNVPKGGVDSLVVALVEVVVIPNGEAVADVEIAPKGDDDELVPPNIVDEGVLFDVPPNVEAPPKIELGAVDAMVAPAETVVDVVDLGAPKADAVEGLELPKIEEVFEAGGIPNIEDEVGLTVLEIVEVG